MLQLQIIGLGVKLAAFMFNGFHGAAPTPISALTIMKDLTAYDQLAIWFWDDIWRCHVL